MKSSRKQASRRWQTPGRQARCLAAPGLLLLMFGSIVCGSMIMALGKPATAAVFDLFDGTGFPETATASITSIDANSGIISARDNATSRTFQFKLTNPTLLRSLNVGHAVFVDFPNKWVSLDGSRVNGNITNIGPVDGSRPIGPVDAAKPLGPVDGARPIGPVDAAKPLGPVDGARPVGPIDGARPIGPIDGAHPLGPVDGAKPVGPIDGSRPLGPVDGAHAASPGGGTNFGPVDGAHSARTGSQTNPIGPVDGAHAASPGGGTNFGPVDGARPGEPCCAITSINPVTGVVTAKNNSTGQSFQFTVKDSALLGSLKIGQAVFANFNNHQVTLDGKTFAGNITSVGH